MKAYWIGLTCMALLGCRSYQKRIGNAPTLTVSVSPERIKRGEYLANHVAVCMDCHSQRNTQLLAGPLVKGSLGAGGQVFDHKLGLPGTFYGKNLTPSALKNWTDGELYQAITTGISKDGKALLPLMPYWSYGKMDSEDIKAIIAYVRTLPSIEKKIPASKPDFWIKPILKQFPQTIKPQQSPAQSDTLAYGKYLLMIAGCTDCHTKRRMGMPIKSKELAGGMTFTLPNGKVKSANLTPDLETGLGYWTKEAFIARFKAFDTLRYTPVEVQDGFNTPMPWTFYSGMNEQDLGAIYTYLHSLKPIKNQVVKYVASTNSLAKQ
ncbi:MAG: c-type cytochrome [Spirosomataceae bacterium]